MVLRQLYFFEDQFFLFDPAEPFLGGEGGGGDPVSAGYTGSKISAAKSDLFFVGSSRQVPKTENFSEVLLLHSFLTKVPFLYHLCVCLVNL